MRDDFGLQPVCEKFELRQARFLGAGDVAFALADAEEDSLRKVFSSSLQSAQSVVSGEELLSFHRQLFLWAGRFSQACKSHNSQPRGG